MTRCERMISTISGARGRGCTSVGWLSIPFLSRALDLPPTPVGARAPHAVVSLSSCPVYRGEGKRWS